MTSPVPVPLPAMPSERCPHCGVVAVVQPSSTLRHVCGVCGKARVPIDAKVERTFAEKDALARATAARNASVMWATTAGVAAAFGAISLLILLGVVLVAHPPVVAAIVALFTALVPIALALYGVARARKKKTEVEPALDDAWATAARDLVETTGKTRPEDVARTMRISPAQAEQLLARLSADSVVASRVTAEGGVEFEAVQPRVRVAEAKKDDEGALAEAHAEADALDEEARRREAER